MYGLAWLVVLLLPMLAVVQNIAASVAAVSRMNLQEAICAKYGRAMALASAAAVVTIGLATLVADLKAGAEAFMLLTGVPAFVAVIPLAAIVGWLLASHSYLRIERVLASFTLIFLCYVASAVLARPNWSEVLRSIVVPHFDFSAAFVIGAIALLGTTLTSYTYYWESIEVAERKPQLAQLGAVKADAVVGMLVAGSSFLFILIATAATSGKHHVTVQTAADAAAALRPLAGAWDQRLFGLGLFASAAIAVPIIAATNGYVVAQGLGAPAGLALAPSEAAVFYRAIFGSLAVAAIGALLPIPTIALLFWVSVAAGIATPLTLALTVLVAADRVVMQDRPIGTALAVAGWTVTGCVTLASIVFLASAARLLSA